MSNDDSVAGSSKTQRVIGYVLSGLAAAFMFLDGGMKLAKPSFVVEATVGLGFPESVIIPLGGVLVACAALYVIPRTAIWGAILLTGYLGGAVAVHVQRSEGWFSTLFPAVFAALFGADFAFATSDCGRCCSGGPEWAQAACRWKKIPANCRSSARPCD